MVDETTVKKSLHKIAQHFNNYFHSILFHSDVGNLFYSSALGAHGVDYFIQWYCVNAFEFKNSEITWPRLYPKYVSEAGVIARFFKYCFKLPCYRLKCPNTGGPLKWCLFLKSEIIHR